MRGAKRTKRSSMKRKYVRDRIQLVEVWLCLLGVNGF